MSHYKTYEITQKEDTFLYVQTTPDHENFTSFPAEETNSAYLQFLTRAQLSDQELKDLPTEVWYDFPEPTKEATE